jgi:hypothetical protein
VGSNPTPGTQSRRSGRVSGSEACMRAPPAARIPAQNGAARHARHSSTRVPSGRRQGPDARARCGPREREDLLPRARQTSIGVAARVILGEAAAVEFRGSQGGRRTPVQLSIRAGASPTFCVGQSSRHRPRRRSLRTSALGALPPNVDACARRCSERDAEVQPEIAVTLRGIRLTGDRGHRYVAHPPTWTIPTRCLVRGFTAGAKDRRALAVPRCRAQEVDDVATHAETG